MEDFANEPEAPQFGGSWAIPAQLDWSDADDRTKKAVAAKLLLARERNRQTRALAQMDLAESPYLLEHRQTLVDRANRLTEMFAQAEQSLSGMQVPQAPSPYQPLNQAETIATGLGMLFGGQTGATVSQTVMDNKRAIAQQEFDRALQQFNLDAAAKQRVMATIQRELEQANQGIDSLDELALRQRMTTEERMRQEAVDAEQAQLDREWRERLEGMKIKGRASAAELAAFRKTMLDEKSTPEQKVAAYESYVEAGGLTNPALDKWVTEKGYTQILKEAGTALTKAKLTTEELKQEAQRLDIKLDQKELEKRTLQVQHLPKQFAMEIALNNARLDQMRAGTARTRQLTAYGAQKPAKDAKKPGLGENVVWQRTLGTMLLKTRQKLIEAQGLAKSETDAALQKEYQRAAVILERQLQDIQAEIDKTGTGEGPVPPLRLVGPIGLRGGL